jgi:hypothetical protein
MNDKTTSYLELTTQGFQLFADAMTAANERALGYAKSLFEISTRPYASTAIETMARENFDRANQIISLTISELQTSGAKSTELGGAAIAHATKMQDAYFTSMRGAVDTGISNLNFVKDTTAQQIDEIAKRMEDVRSRTAAQVSAN